MAGSLLVLLSPILLGAAAIWLIWVTSQKARTRYAFAGAVLGSIVVAYETFLLSLCGTGENTSTTCHGSTHLLGFLGIPFLFCVALGVSGIRGFLGWLLGAVGLLIALWLPFALQTG